MRKCEHHECRRVNVEYIDHGRAIAHDNGRGTEYHRFTANLRGEYPSHVGYGDSKEEALEDLKRRSGYAAALLAGGDGDNPDDTDEADTVMPGDREERL